MAIAARDAKPCLQRVVEHWIAGGVGEVGQHNSIRPGKRVGFAAVQEERAAASAIATIVAAE